MALMTKGQPQPLRTLSRTSSFSAATSSSASSKYDNPTMVTSRNLQCMPSDDEDDLEDDYEEEEEDDDDNLLLSEAIKHPFFSIETDFPKNYKRKSAGMAKEEDVQDNGPQRNGKTQHPQRHSIGLPIQTTPSPAAVARASHHLTTSASYPNTHNNNNNDNSTNAKSTMMAPQPLISIEPTPSTTTSVNPPTNAFHHPLPSNASQYLRHRASLSGVDLIMAREQFEQQKKKNKNHPLNQKKWDPTHAPIGGLLARLPQQGQHTISFQQQQLQQMQFQQQQQMLFYQQQQQQQMYQHYYYYPVQRSLNGSTFPRSPTTHLPRW
ncbi:unnamed protein product [Absidia cylindrospora]